MTATPSLSLSELARKLEEGQRARRLRERSRPWAPMMTPATGLGYTCDRRNVYQRVRPSDAQGIGEELASIFTEGDLHQKDVRAELLELGYEVVEAEVNFKDKRLEISGTIDGKIMAAGWADERGRPRRIPVEIKSTSGAAPTDAASWRNSETLLLRRYFSQIQIYLYLTSEPEALGIFKSKITGLWSVVPVALDYAYVEGLLQRAERIRDAVALADGIEADDEMEAVLPPRDPTRAECIGCPWKDTLCHPEEQPADPLLLADDIVLKAQIARREQLDTARREFEKVDASLKQRFKLTAGERFVVGGEWLVTKKQQANGTRIAFSPLKG